MAKSKLIRLLLRRKLIAAYGEETLLRRCLKLWQLIGIGLGATLGATAYVVIGMVAMEQAGPSIILCFLMGATAAMLAGLCYAELGSRMPRAGSAYEYAFATLGEFCAFLFGWNIILEYFCGGAYVARSLSGYIDTLVDKNITTWYRKVTKLPGSVFGEYFDVMAFFLVVSMGVLIGSGVRTSTNIHTCLTIVNICVIVFIICAGSMKADPSNWFIPESEVPEGKGTGGFFPYGVSGTFRGAGVCFFGFVGFESLTYAGEEVKNPKRNVPLAIFITITTICILYCLVCIVQTMMVPYYALDPTAALLESFRAVGWDWTKYIVLPGAICGMLASMFGSIMPVPRLMMSMARDGLLCRSFSIVNTYTQTPLCATVVSTIAISFLAGLLELDQLILMLCVGTLLSYNCVALCVLVLRYQPQAPSYVRVSFKSMMQSFRVKEATKSSQALVFTCVFLYMLLCFLASIISFYANSVITVGVFHVLIIVLIIFVYLQPQKIRLFDSHAFRTPLVPLIPMISLYVNINLMVLLELPVYKRTSVWFCIGIPIYILCIFLYKRYTNRNMAIFDNQHPEPMAPDDEGHDQKRAAKRSISKNDKRLQTTSDPGETSEPTSNVERNNEIIIQQAIVESNAEKEAKIIELLDQVLQDEEDSYDKTVGLRQQNIDSISVEENQRITTKSLGELSDAGSDDAASASNQNLSKYDVVAEVHREDLPKVFEEYEVNDDEVDGISSHKELDVSKQNLETTELKENNINTGFNDSETNSHTDESGYSDTMKSTINESTDDTTNENTPYIPTPPPLDESFFTNSVIHKSYSFSSRPPKVVQIDIEEDIKPRVSLQSNGSLDDGHIVFGSDKQMHFMTKLNTLFKSKMVNESDNDQRKRSHSTGNVTDNSELRSSEYPPRLANLNKELLSKEGSYHLKPVFTETVTLEESPTQADTEETSMTRDEMKSKLESIFASGGPQLIKPRLQKSLPLTQENSQSTESNTYINRKPNKIEKNDTLKRQKDRFSAVLNSFMLNLNKESEF